MNTKNKQQLNDFFEVIISLLRNSPLTLVLDNQGSTKGQIYTVSKATHEQAARGCATSALFSGTATETIKYLQGVRDTLIDLSPSL